MTYEQTISDVVKVVEAVGARITVSAASAAFVVFAVRARRADTAQGTYPDLRHDQSHCIMLGLEVLMFADIVSEHRRSDPQSVAALGIIVVIRILLSFEVVRDLVEL